MTTVYVLAGVTEYAGDTVLGVYQTYEEADVAYVQYCIEQSAFDDYTIHTIELGAPAQFRW